MCNLRFTSSLSPSRAYFQRIWRLLSSVLLIFCLAGCSTYEIITSREKAKPVAKAKLAPNLDNLIASPPFSSANEYILNSANIKKVVIVAKSSSFLEIVNYDHDNPIIRVPDDSFHYISAFPDSSGKGGTDSSAMLGSIANNPEAIILLPIIMPVALLFSIPSGEDDLSLGDTAGHNIYDVDIAEYYIRRKIDLDNIKNDFFLKITDYGNKKTKIKFVLTKDNKQGSRTDIINDPSSMDDSNNAVLHISSPRFELDRKNGHLITKTKARLISLRDGSVLVENDFKLYSSPHLIKEWMDNNATLLGETADSEAKRLAESIIGVYFLNNRR